MFPNILNLTQLESGSSWPEWAGTKEPTNQRTDCSNDIKSFSSSHFVVESSDSSHILSGLGSSQRPFQYRSHSPGKRPFSPLSSLSAHVLVLGVAMFFSSSSFFSFLVVFTSPKRALAMTLLRQDFPLHNPGGGGGDGLVVACTPSLCRTVFQWGPTQWREW